VLSDREFIAFKTIGEKYDDWIPGIYETNRFFRNEILHGSAARKKMMMDDLRNSPEGDLVARIEDIVSSELGVPITIRDDPIILDYRADTLANTISDNTPEDKRTILLANANAFGGTFTTSGVPCHIDADPDQDIERAFINFSLITTHEPGTQLVFGSTRDCDTSELAFSIPMDNANSIVAWWGDMWPHKLTPIRINSKNCVVTGADKQRVQFTCEPGRRMVTILNSIGYKKGRAASIAQNFQRNGQNRNKDRRHKWKQRK